MEAGGNCCRLCKHIGFIVRRIIWPGRYRGGASGAEVGGKIEGLVGMGFVGGGFRTHGRYFNWISKGFNGVISDYLVFQWQCSSNCSDCCYLRKVEQAA